MKNRILIFIFLIASCSTLSMELKAQYFENKKQKKSFKENIYFGGGLGLQFGTVTQIEVAPIVGYKVSERFQPGISLTYSYFRDNYYNPPLDFSTYGGSIFARFFLFEGLFAQAEAEALNVEAFSSPTKSERLWIGNYLIGGGYFQKIGNRGGMYLLVLWNLNQTEYTPYSNPVIRIGFAF